MTWLDLLRTLALGGALVAAPAAASGQPGAPDSLRLGALHRQAVGADPRSRQFDLLSKQTMIKVGNLRVGWLPSIRGESKAQYQSDVFSAPASAASLGFPTPTKDSYDSRVTIEQTVVDPTIAARQRVERARLAGSEAQVQVTLYGLRAEVNDAFFAAALLAERGRILAVTVADLEQRLREATVRVREGVALPSDTAAIRATLLARSQDDAEVVAKRRAALIRLAELTKRPVADLSPTALPDLTDAAATARRGIDSLRLRPEYAQFARERELLVRQQEAVAAELRPKVTAFGQAGFGRPGLNPVGDSFDAFYTVGIGVKWAPWNWGSNQRERMALALQSRIVATEEAALASRFIREVQNDLADIDRLDAALGLDDQIVALREGVEQETLIRFREGVITASEYVDRNTDVLEARLARASHRVEQVYARARLLTTLGLEIR